MTTISERAAQNVETIVFFVLVVLIAARSGRKAAAQLVLFQPLKTGALTLFLVGVVVFFAYSPSLNDPLLSDDYILIRTPAALSNLASSFIKPSGDGAMRPVGDLAFGAFKYWAGTEPVRWHLLGVSLHILNVVMVYWLSRRFSGCGLIAAIAAALFGLHAAHPEAVAWASSAFDLLATFFLLAALVSMTVESAGAVLVTAITTALAILSKESAYCLPLIALLLFTAGGALSRVRRWAIGVSGAVSALLFAVRWNVFHGPGGYLDAATGRAQILNITFVSVVKTLIYRPWAVLFAPLNLSERPGVWTLIFFGISTLALILLIFYSGLARRWRLMLIAASVAALIPPIHLALIPANLLGTRVFYLATVFSSIWLATEIASLSSKKQIAFAGASVACFHLFALHHNLAVRSRVASLGGSACAGATSFLAGQSGARDLTVQGLPKSLDGVFFFANGFQQCVQSRLGEAIRVDVPQGENAGVATNTLRWDRGGRRLTYQGGTIPFMRE